MINPYDNVHVTDNFNVLKLWKEGKNAPKYMEVEVGFPSDAEPLLMEYCEDKRDPTNTVYAYVPTQVVTNVIAKHGGMVEGEAPPGVVPLIASRR